MILRRLRYNLILLFRQNKSAHQISLGFVIGFFPCWYPTFGVGLALSVALAKFVRGNILASVIAASIGSFLWPMLFFLNYKAGILLRGLMSGETEEIGDHLKLEEIWPDEYEEPAEQINAWGQAGIDFLWGAVLNSIVLTIIGYLIVRILITRYRLDILRLIRGKRTVKRQRVRK
ncbi:DUF2062 domain-containing protein [Paenibacillus abyssi]|uniref:DUF2062 domain-containing protein n=1 Tax=Paenibacillus abyssi TaxID=1340531 RepID=A0A917D2Q7_9BACL|nr:DUF2062 domain-containing protein [Paenibacillus abyssi]GGG04643.1 hypothetical protein GCM10010916_22090 [Paenibacillus abyssi]